MRVGNGETVATGKWQENMTMKIKVIIAILTIVALLTLVACESAQDIESEVLSSEHNEVPHYEETQQKQDYNVEPDIDEQYNDDQYANDVDDADELYVIDGIEVSEFALNIHDWENFAWEQEYFADRRAPIRFDESMPHGHLAVQYIELINDHLYARTPFSYREKEAAVWLVEELIAMGYSWYDIYVQEFTMLGGMNWEDLMILTGPLGVWGARHDFFDSEMRETTQLSQNVILTVPGQSERTIIVGAHYDGWPVHGASDNASGMALLLESARRMLQIDNYYTIVYIFFGAEEIGLIGAEYYVSNMTDEQSDNLLLMINADVLFEGPYLIYSAAYSNLEWNNERGGLHIGTNELTQQIDVIAYELDLGLISYPYVVRQINSDFRPFLHNGYTVVNLAGLAEAEYPYDMWTVWVDSQIFMLQILHTADDNFHVIEERWPGKIATNMNVFSIFLEEMLLMN